MAASTADQRELLPRREESKPSCFCRLFGCLGTVVCDLLTIVLILVLICILLPFLLVVCLFPALERLIFCCSKREYMDGISAVQHNLQRGSAIHGVFVCEEKVKASDLHENFKQVYCTSHALRRFTMRAPPRSFLWPYWEPISGHLDDEYHFVTISQQMTMPQVEEYITQLEADMLDFTKPLWKLYIFENFTDEFGKDCSLGILRLHHCMDDGFTALRVFMQGCDPKTPPEAPVRSRGTTRPRTPFYKVPSLFLKAFRKLLLMPPDSPSTFKNSQWLYDDGPKTCSWHTLPDVSVDDLKAFGKSEYGGGATVNDMLVVALQGAFRRFASGSGSALSDLTACIWVSLSPMSDIFKTLEQVPLVWGNSNLGACYIKLNLVDAPDEVVRGKVIPVVEAMRKKTASPELPFEAPLAAKLQALFGWMPRVIARPLWNATAYKVSVSTSNVPGPSFPVKWCGAPLRTMSFFVPPTATISIFVTISTYNGTISVGMSADAALLSMDDVRKLTGECFADEMRNILATRDKLPSV